MYQNNKNNPNKLDLNKSIYIRGYTKLFAITNNTITEVYFDRFETKNYRDLIYVKTVSGNKSSFYYFPDTKYLFPNKDDALAAISREMRSTSSSPVIASVVQAFSRLPNAKKPSMSKEEEMANEKSYHNTVDNSLKNSISNIDLEIEENENYLANAKYDLREKMIAAREDRAYLSDSEYISYNIKSENAKQRIRTGTQRKIYYQTIRNTPYFARIDCGSSEYDLHSAYIGNYDIPGYVVDWRRSDIGNVYYNTSLFLNQKGIYIALKRNFTINDAQFHTYNDALNRYNYTNRATSINVTKKTTPDGLFGKSHEYVENINVSEDASSEFADERLTEMLKEGRLDKTTHDIIKTIQSEQYSIITSDFQKNSVVNGCAGSGKTMIMYHRLSYMAYNYENVLGRKFNPNNVYIISPSPFFDSANTELMKKLSIDKVNQAQFPVHVENLINRYCTQNNITAFNGIADFFKNNTTTSANFYNSYSFEYYYDKVKLFFSDNNPVQGKEYQSWVLNIANKILTAYNFQEIPNDLEIYQKADVQNILNSKLYYQNDCFKKSSSDPQNAVYFSPLAVSTISYENILESLNEHSTNSNIYITRLSRINRYISLLKVSLSYKTKLDSRKQTSTSISDFWQLCDNSTAFQKMLALLSVQKLLESMIFSHTDKSDFIIKCLFIYDKLFGEDYWSDFNLYLLAILNDTYQPAISENSLIFIDEFQNYSSFELLCIKNAFSYPVFNFFGDYDQCIDEKGKDLSSNIKSLFSPDVYNLNINYRNARQITEYINKKIHKNMAPIGIPGKISVTPFKFCNFKLQDRTAIICKDTGLAFDLLKQRINTKLINNMSLSKVLTNDKITILSVNECKGLEFEKVYVFDYDMTDNERYVAYTRALDFLIVVEDNLIELKKKNDISKKEASSKPVIKKEDIVEKTSEAVKKPTQNTNYSFENETTFLRRLITEKEKLLEEKTKKFEDEISLLKTLLSEKDVLLEEKTKNFGEYKTETIHRLDNETKYGQTLSFKIYQIALEKYNTYNIQQLLDAIALFEIIPDYQDSLEKKNEAKNLIEALKKKESDSLIMYRRNRNICQHCGGAFKGLFSKYCSICGRKKDY